MQNILDINPFKNHMFFVIRSRVCYTDILLFCNGIAEKKLQKKSNPALR